MKKDTLSSGQNIIINFFGISFHLIEILPTDHILLGKKLRTDFFNIWRFLFFLPIFNKLNINFEK